MIETILIITYIVFTVILLIVGYIIYAKELTKELTKEEKVDYFFGLASLSSLWPFLLIVIILSSPYWIQYLIKRGNKI